MKNVEHSKSPVVVRADDPSLTATAGMVCIAEAVRALGYVEAIDAFVGPIKQRDRGLSAGEFVVSLAECLLAGGDFLANLDRDWADTAARALRSVPVPPASTTARTLAQRFGPDELAGIEVAWVETAARAVELAAPTERVRLMTQRPTVDVDSTEIEVFGRAKRGVAYNYLGQLAGRVLLATWAEAGSPSPAPRLMISMAPSLSSPGARAQRCVIDQIRRAVMSEVIAPAGRRARVQDGHRTDAVGGRKPTQDVRRHRASMDPRVASEHERRRRSGFRGQRARAGPR